jgi:hypothetical protein
MTDYRRLTIKILDQLSEDAEVQLQLTAAELIQSVISEFADEIPSMSKDPTIYQLQRGDGTALIDNERIASQLGQELVLRFTEKGSTLPAGSEALPGGYYLREPQSGRVFALRWSPAIIGRSDQRLADEALLAANLAGLPQSERISRRHARVFRRGPELMIECLADNPLKLRRADGELQLIRNTPQPLQTGDRIFFEFSQIQLEVIQRAG